MTQIIMQHLKLFRKFIQIWESDCPFVSCVDPSVLYLWFSTAAARLLALMMHTITLCSRRQLAPKWSCCHISPKFSAFLHNSVLAALCTGNWRLEDRWRCGGDGCAIMRYGYPGLPYTLTPSRKRDTITSVKSEHQKEKKAPELLLSNFTRFFETKFQHMCLCLSLWYTYSENWSLWDVLCKFNSDLIKWN